MRRSPRCRRCPPARAAGSSAGARGWSSADGTRRPLRLATPYDVALRRRGGVVTQRPAKPFTPVRFRSSPLRRGPIRTVAVFGGNSEIALAIVEALARDDDLERVVPAVRAPANAPGRAPLEAHSIDAATVPFDSDATASHKAAMEEVLQALDGEPLDLAIVAFARLGDQDRAKRDPAAAAQLATTNFTGAVSVLTILAE